jgi:hypothetical protein
MKYAQSKVKSSPNHTSLSIIDRVIRTIRDMAYQMGVEDIIPDVMKRIVQFYNTAPHKTLSKIMGFEVSPNMAEQDLDLEIEIIRRFQIKNEEIRNQHGFVLDIGSKVYVYNPRDTVNKRRTSIKPYVGVVVGFNGVLYQVRTPNGIQKYSRSQLKPI